MIAYFSIHYYTDVAKLLEEAFVEVLSSYNILPNISLQIKLA